MRWTIRLAVALVLALALVPAAAAPAAQDGGSVAQRVSAELRRAKDARATPEERFAAMERLLDLEADGPYRLARELERDLPKRRKRLAKEASEVLDDYERVARGLVEGRLDAEGRAAVEAARAAIVANARDGGLTKAAVHERSDPALARLEELLVVRQSEVWDADEEGFERYVALLDELAEERRLFSYWSRARDRLAAREDGRRQAQRLKEQADPEPVEEALLAEMGLRVLLAVPGPARTEAVLRGNLALAPELDPEEARGVRRLNRVRLLAGLGVLAIDPKLCEACRGHSQDMVELGFFSHESPVPGKEDFGKRAALAGTTASGENIAAGQDTGEGAIEAWWYSPGHHRNMMGGHARVGLGRHETTWTQLLGG